MIGIGFWGRLYAHHHIGSTPSDVVMSEDPDLKREDAIFHSCEVLKYRELKPWR